MAEIKLTKNELRLQEVRLGQLERYLPTLQLKKAQLQQEVGLARSEIKSLKNALKLKELKVEGFSELLSDQFSIDLDQVAVVERIETTAENIAGVEVPIYQETLFVQYDYPLYDTPPWLDPAIVQIRAYMSTKAEIDIALKKLELLEEELRQVAIRVNLFEKILIPRAKKNIKTIKVFLGDQELAAVSQAKVAKAKIEERKKQCVSM